LAIAVAELDRARELFDAAERALAHVPTAAPPFFTAITVCWVIDNRGAMLLPVGEDSMLLGRRVGAEQARGHIAAAAAIVERLSGRIPSALELLDDAGSRFAALGDVYGHAYVTGQRGHTLRWAGDFDAAVRCFDDAEALRVSVRDVRAIAMATAGRSFAEALSGRVADARRGISEAIERMRQTGDVPGVALTLNNAALVEMIAGDPEHALDYLGEVLSFGQAVPVHVHGWHCFLIATLRASLGDLDGSAIAAAEAQASFERLGDERGILAMQRARKESRISLSSSD
jgi:tetratricopeptide (TPR) repeat protein